MRTAAAAAGLGLIEAQALRSAKNRCRRLSIWSQCAGLFFSGEAIPRRWRPAPVCPFLELEEEPDELVGP